MSFYSTYDLIDLVRDDGIKSFNAREIATGRMVLVHLFTRPDSPEMLALLNKVANLPADARSQILMQGVHEGTPYVVTAPITAYPGIREWIVNQSVSAPPAAIPPGQTQTRPAAAASVPEDDPFAALFKKPGATPPPSATQATRVPVRPATEDFRHLIETPTSKKRAIKPGQADGSHAESNPNAEPAVESGPGEFTRLFQAPPPASGPATPPPPPGATTPRHEPGEFTRLFQAPGPAASPQPPAAPPAPPAPRAPAEPAHQPGEFTRTFGALSSTPAASSTPASEPGEFTRTFGALSQSAGPAPSPPPAQEPGEFTRLFQTSGVKSADQIPTKVSQPTLDQQQPGEFTRTFGALSAQPSPPPAAPPPQDAGEFTRLFQTGAKPAEPIPAQRSQAASPGTPGQEAGEFTRLFHTGSVSPQPATPPPAPAGSAPSKEPGDLTRMFETAKQRPAAAPPSGEFTRMFSSPPPQVPPQSPASPSTPAPAGEFTRMFKSPSTSPPPNPSTPSGSPKSDEPGEFTRMFDSPLHPKPLGTTHGGAPDPFAGRAGNITPPQATPVGEFTSMFGKGGVTPQAAPKGPPTPRSDADVGATSVFKQPQPSYSYTPSQSVGQSDFTTMMARPSKGILAEAAAATPAVEKKSVFKTYLPLILFGALLLVIVIAVIIFLAMRKH